MEIIITNKKSDIDFDKLMEVYYESNMENIEKSSYFSVESIDAFREKEIFDNYKKDYINYLKEDFLANKENYIAIIRNKDTYLSALRLHYEEDCYLIEALETNPDFRNRGYGEKLLKSVLIKFPKKTVFNSEVGLNNKKSLGLHKKLGFKILERRKSNLLLAYNIE